MIHPAMLRSGAELDRIIVWVASGELPRPAVPVWRPDVPREQAVRLAVATGADPVALAELLSSLDLSQDTR
jgi:hypothetical protein